MDFEVEYPPTLSDVEREPVNETATVAGISVWHMVRTMVVADTILYVRG